MGRSNKDKPPGVIGEVIPIDLLNAARDAIEGNLTTVQVIRIISSTLDVRNQIPAEEFIARLTPLLITIEQDIIRLNAEKELRATAKAVIAKEKENKQKWKKRR